MQFRWNFKFIFFLLIVLFYLFLCDYNWWIISVGNSVCVQYTYLLTITNYYYNIFEFIIFIIWGLELLFYTMWDCDLIVVIYNVDVVFYIYYLVYNLYKSSMTLWKTLLSATVQLFARFPLLNFSILQPKFCRSFQSRKFYAGLEHSIFKTVDQLTIFPTKKQY